MRDAEKVVNQPYSGNFRELMAFINKLRQEFMVFLATIKCVKNHEKVIIYDSHGPIYVGKLVGVEPSNLNVILYNALNTRSSHVVPKVLIRGDVVKRIEYVTDSELRKILPKITGRREGEKN